MATLNENIQQAINDFDEIQEAIIEKGVDVPAGTPTRKYGDKIREIETGITPTGTIKITENGSYDVTQYATADVNVEGITVNESYDISEGKLNAATVELEGGVIAHIPDGVTTLGKQAFTDNRIINKVVMPNSVTTAEDGTPYGYDSGVFYNCEVLRECVFSNNLTSIAAYMFNNCHRLSKISLPDSITTIKQSAFQYCDALTELIVPDSVTSIGNSTFYSCRGLTSISIPDSVTNIGYDAFAYCTSLTSITIPDSVTNIGERAFANCTSLTDVYYTSTQAEWEQITIGADAIPAGATIHYEYTPEQL